MKTLTYTTAIVMAMSATSVFAHHPAAEMVSDATYEMITENLVEAASPHLDIDMDAMGATTTMATGDMDVSATARDQAGFTSGAEDSQAGEMTLDQPQEAMGPASAAGTIGLMEEVTP